VIVLSDAPENILDRITFYDDNSNRIPKQLTKREKKLYLKEIRKDITYYRSFYKKADYHVDIAGSGVSGSVEKIVNLLGRKGLGLDF
jgi:shikimate kinase